MVTYSISGHAMLQIKARIPTFMIVCAKARENAA
jgi:hypothetical protein